MIKEWPEVMTNQQAAEYLQVTVRTIYNLINDNKIRASKVGREWRIRKTDLDAYLDSTTNK